MGYYYQIQVWLPTAQKSIWEGGRKGERERYVGRKFLLIRMLAIWGGGGLGSPQNPISEDCAWPWKLLKGKGKPCQLIIERRGQSCCHPYCVKSCWFVIFFSCYLVHTFCSWRLLKEKLGKRSGHLWITYSSLLLPWSMERTEKLAEGLHVPKIWKVCQGQRSVGHRGAWFKVSDKTRGSPVESFFLQRTLSCQMLLCSFTLWTEGSGTRGSYCRLLRYVATRDPRRDYLLIWACFNITEQHVTPSLAQLSLWS